MILGRTWYSLDKPIKILNSIGIPWSSVSEKHSSKWDCPQKIAYVLTMRDLKQRKPISEQDWRRITKQLPAKFRSEPVFSRGTKSKWDKLACSQDLDIHYSQLHELGAEPMFFQILDEDLWKTDMFLLIDNAIEQWGIANVRNPSVRIGTAHSVKGMEADIVYCMALSTEASAKSDPHEERCLRYVAVTRAAKHFRLVVDAADTYRGKPVFWPAPLNFSTYDRNQEYLDERITTAGENHPAPEVKFHAGPKTTTGVPDIICCHRGHFMALEVKLPGNNPTPIQIHQQTKIRQNGGTSEVVTSVDDVIEILRRIDNERNDNA
jgi:hypothetical protein